jgi:WD40 repeat protein
VWDLTTGRQLHRLEGYPIWLTAVAISRDGIVAVIAGDDRIGARTDRSVRVWDLMRTERSRFTVFSLDTLGETAGLLYLG